MLYTKPHTHRLFYVTLLESVRVILNCYSIGHLEACGGTGTVTMNRFDACKASKYTVVTAGLEPATLEYAEV